VTGAEASAVFDFAVGVAGPPALAALITAAARLAGPGEFLTLGETWTGIAAMLALIAPAEHHLVTAAGGAVSVALSICWRWWRGGRDQAPGTAGSGKVARARLAAMVRAMRDLAPRLARPVLGTA
jgi:hypothetical protein